MLILAACLFGLFGLRFYLAAMLSAIVLGRIAAGPQPSVRGSFDNDAPGSHSGGFHWDVVRIGLTERIRRIVPGDLSEALGAIETSRHDLANSADSGFARELNITTPAGALEFLPTGMAYFMFSPAPWQWGRVRQNLVIPETAFWICLYPLMAWGMIRGLKQNFQSSGLLLAAVIPISCLYALFSGNIGTAYRMRMQVWLLLAIFAGWGWEAWAGAEGGTRSGPADYGAAHGEGNVNILVLTPSRYDSAPGHALSYGAMGAPPRRATASRSVLNPSRMKLCSGPYMSRDSSCGSRRWLCAPWRGGSGRSGRRSIMTRSSCTGKRRCWALPCWNACWRCAECR